MNRAQLHREALRRLGFAVPPRRSLLRRAVDLCRRWMWRRDRRAEERRRIGEMDMW